MKHQFQQKRKLPKSVRPEEWELLVKVIPKKNKYMVISFLLAYGSGMRVSEVTRCRPEHIRENNSIFIPESKNDVERVVPLPKGWKKSFTELLPIPKSIRTLERWFEKCKVKAGLNPKYTFHSLRHGFATRCMESGIPLNQLQLAMGHADIKTTSIYTRASPQDLLKSYEENF